MLVNFGVQLLGILIFLFLFWRRLKDDYSSAIIFRTAFLVLVGIGVGSFLSFRFFPKWFFWTSFICGSLGLSASIYLIKLKTFEVFEAFVISLLPWLSLVFFANSVTKSSLSSFLGFLVILIFIFISYFFDTHYKKFAWYKSGRIGFAGLATSFLFFATRFVLAIFKFSVLSFVGRSEIVISGILMITCFFFLLDLGRLKK